MPTDRDGLGASGMSSSRTPKRPRSTGAASSERPVEAMTTSRVCDLTEEPAAAIPSPTSQPLPPSAQCRPPSGCPPMPGMGQICLGPPPPPPPPLAAALMGVPRGWLECARGGASLHGLCPTKTPLSSQRFPWTDRSTRWSPTDCVVGCGGKRVRLIIELTGCCDPAEPSSGVGAQYYSAKELPTGVRHVRLPVAAGGVVPRRGAIEYAIEVLKSFVGTHDAATTVCAAASNHGPRALDAALLPGRLRSCH